MPTASDHGPYLSAAVLCERALQETDGVLTLVRVIDKVTVAFLGSSDQTPDQMPAAMVSLTLVIILRAGEARGPYIVNARPEDPTGAQLAPTALPMRFTGPDEQAVNVLVNLNLGVHYEGLFWIDVSLGEDEQLLTRVPLRIEYQPAQGPTPPAPEAPATPG